MTDRSDVQEYIKKENRRRGRGPDEEGEEEGDGRNRGLYGMSEWENPAADGRLSGYTGRI
jgi:hypothetical protein